MAIFGFTLILICFPCCFYHWTLPSRQYHFLLFWEMQKPKAKQFRTRIFFWAKNNNKNYFWDLCIFGFTWFYNVFFVVFIVEPCNACNIAFCFCEHKNNKVFLRLVYIFVYLILQCFLVFGFVVCVVSMFACVWVISLFIFMQKARKGRSQLGYAFKPFSRWIFVLPPFCGELLRGVLCCLNIIWECYSFCIFKFTRYLNEYFGGKWSYLGVPRKQNCLYCTLACTVVSSFCWNHAERHYLGHL